MTLKQVKGILEKHSSQFILAFIYGSLARGEQDSYSDVDLILLRNTQREFFDRIREIFDLVFELPRADILIYTPDEFEQLVHAEGNFFLKRVMQEAVEIEGQQKGSGALAETGGE